LDFVSPDLDFVSFGFDFVPRGFGFPSLDLETLPLRSFVDVERLRVELARKLDVSSAETSIPP
jgi:hypothetical protein